jgi:uncharacterized Zn-binding protein involved in type VI secretion
MTDAQPGLASVTETNVGADFSSWWTGLKDAVVGPKGAVPPRPGAPRPTAGQQTAQALQRAQAAASSVVGAIGLLQYALQTGFGELTSGIAAHFPALPAATLMMPYLGLPHTHDHPPSGFPPDPPIPLPSFGAIMFGTCMSVMINGLPAARAGDIGLAPTCGGFSPYFEIVTGSSNVFIGGMRAARMSDFCKVCVPATPEATGPLAAISKVMQFGFPAVEGLSAVADGAEAAAADSASMAAAETLSAAMNAAQAVSDAIWMAMAALMGKDPALEPELAVGAVVMGSPNVLIGGFPMGNYRELVEGLLGKLSGSDAVVEDEPEEDGSEDGGGDDNNDDGGVGASGDC